MANWTKGYGLGHSIKVEHSDTAKVLGLRGVIERLANIPSTSSGLGQDNPETSWTSGGATVTVTTIRQPGESASDVEARHAEEVKAWRIVFPED